MHACIFSDVGVRIMYVQRQRVRQCDWHHIDYGTDGRSPAESSDTEPTFQEDNKKNGYGSLLLSSSKDFVPVD